MSLAAPAAVVSVQAAPGSFKPRQTYTNWYWSDPAAATHTSLDGFLQINSDPSLVHARIGYFWAHQFVLPGGGGYMGIQTQGEAGAHRGKVAIFSMWGATQGVEGAHCAMSTANFDGVAGDSGSSCRIPLSWKAGDSYRFRVEHWGTAAGIRRWRSSVLNVKTGALQVIGVIKTSLAHGLLKGEMTNWTEYYSPGRAECDAPYSDVVFGAPTLDGRPSVSHRSNLKEQVQGCTDSTVADVGGGVRHEVSTSRKTAPLPLPTHGTPVSDLPMTSWSAPYLRRDTSIVGNPLNLAGRIFSKGLGTYAPSDLRYALNGKYSRFVAYVNLDYPSEQGTVTFQVWADQALLFDSGLMDVWSRTQQINVNVAGRRELRLVVTDGGDGNYADWAAWGDPRLLPSTAVANFVGDGSADLAVFRPSSSTWWIDGRSPPVYWGVAGDIPVPADYDGDGDTDIMIYRPSTGVWYDHARWSATQWGAAGDVPVPGDYNGDGKAELAVYRPATGDWWMYGKQPVTWGEPGDVPVPGDYDGDSRTDIVIYRPSTGSWFDHARLAVTQWGVPGDIPVPGDYDGDGDADVMVYRPSTGQWYDHGRWAVTQWGVPGDVPVPGDYDGNGATDIMIYRPSTGQWFDRARSRATYWGLPGDLPLPLPYAIRRMT